jgi:RNA polymerase sigma factor (sigma-70 family)
MDDRDIVAAIIAGDPAGLARAYDRYAASLHAYCRTLLGEPADAADAVQDTFVVAAAKAGGLRDPGRLRPWLYAVARNECHRRLRARSRQADLDEAAGLSDDSATVTDSAERSELRGLMLAAIGGLNPGDREIIELNLRHDLDGADLAGALGVPLRQAHALASRARSQLERALGALLVARTGRRQCEVLDGILAGWDGALTPLLRKRVSRHIENCEICDERKRRVLTPAALLSVLPLVPIPPGLRHQVLRLVADTSPEAVAYRAHVVSRAGPFDSAGFPVSASPPGRARRPRRPGGRGGPSVAASVSAVAALVLLGGGTATVLLLLGSGHGTPVAGSGLPPAAQATIPTPASATSPEPPSPTPAVLPPLPGRVAPSASGPAAVVSSTPAPPSSAPPHSSAPHSSPPSSAPPSPGTLSETPNVVILAQAGSAGRAAGPRQAAAGGGTWSGTFTVIAVGGPVSYTVTGPSFVSVSPARATARPGTPLTVTVSVTASPNLPFLSTLTVSPGGLPIVVEFPPSDHAPPTSPPPSSSPPPTQPPPPKDSVARLEGLRA